MAWANEYVKYVMNTHVTRTIESSFSPSPHTEGLGAPVGDNPSYFIQIQYLWRKFIATLPPCFYDFYNIFPFSTRTLTTVNTAVHIYIRT
jgi:hypothetical protein